MGVDLNQRGVLKPCRLQTESLSTGPGAKFNCGERVHDGK